MTQNSSQRARDMQPAVDTMEPRSRAMRMVMELQIFYVLSFLNRHLKIVLDDLFKTSVRFRWRIFFYSTAKE